VQRATYLEDERKEWFDAHAKEIREFILPNRGHFDGDEFKEGAKRRSGSTLINPSATRALHVLAAGMRSGLSSPSRKWFKPEFPDKDLMRWGPAKAWLEDMERALYAILAGKCGFYGASYNAYLEEAGFGTACCYVEEDPVSVCRFRGITAGEYAIAENEAGDVDTVYRRFKMTAKRMQEKFGEENLSETVKASLKEGGNPYDHHEILHCAEPNTREGAMKAWVSVYIDTNNQQTILKRGGWDVFKYLCPRWDVSGERVYGNSPGQDVLPDVKGLQEEEKSLLMSLHKTINPPMKKPSSFKDRLSLLPGAENIYEGGKYNDVGPLYQTALRIDHAVADIQRREAMIRAALFNDVFLMLTEHPDMTATEVLERKAEKVLILGPVVESQIHDFLDPALDLVFHFGAKAGRIPPPPQELAGAEFKWEYISALAQAQKLAGTESIDRLTAKVGELSQLNPEALDKIDVDEAIDTYAEMVGAPFGVVRSQEIVIEMRKARAERMVAEQQKAEAAQEAAMKTTQMVELSKVKTDERNLATDMANAAGGGA